jgi:hypothetical protein
VLAESFVAEVLKMGHGASNKVEDIEQANDA